MHIDRIYVENFLSFDTFAWDRLDPTLNVLVGANGTGKSNLFHALRAVRSAVKQLTAPAYLGRPITRPPVVWKWDHVRYRGDDTRNTRIAIDVALTTATERDLLTIFLAASLLSTQDIQNVVARESQVNADVTGLHGFAAWLERHIESATAWLTTGRFVVSSVDDSLSWDCRYEARDSGVAPFWWDLRTPGIRAKAEAISASVPSLFVAWRERLAEEERHALDLALAKQPEGRFPDTLDLHDLPTWVNPAYDKPLGAHKWNMLGPAPRLIQRLDSLLPAERPSSQVIGGSEVWNRLFGAAFVFTDNVRLPPRTQYTADELEKAPIDLSDGRDLAAYLYRLSVGNNVERKTYVQIQTLFRELTGRTFEVVRPEQGSAREISRAC